MATLLSHFEVAVYRSLGAAFIGFAVACCLYGVLLSQIVAYYLRYHQDKPLYKCLVAILGILGTLDQVFIAHAVYWYGITNFENPLVLKEAKTRWSIILQLTTGSLAGAIVKTFFGLRVWRFSERNKFITGFILSLALGQLGLAIAYTVKAFLFPSIPVALQKLRILGTVSLGTGVLTDIVTATALCYYLNKLRTGHESSDSLVRRLSVYAINTGVVTSATSTGTLILYNALPVADTAYISLYFITSKLYAISFLATLNTRQIIRGRGTDDEVSTNDTNMFHLGTARVPTVGGIEVDRERQWNTEKVGLISPQDESPLNSSMQLVDMTMSNAVHRP